MRIAAPAVTDLPIPRWFFTVRARRESMSGSTPQITAYVSVPTGGGRVRFTLWSVENVTSTTPESFTFGTPTHPLTLEPWTRGQIGAAFCGVFVTPQAGVRILSIEARALTALPMPAELARVDWFRSTTTAVPPETAKPLMSWPTLIPPADQPPSAGAYYYTARLRDAWERTLRTTTPTLVTVS